METENTTPSSTGSTGQAFQQSGLEMLPNSTAILVLGILSIVICCGGLILAIIALVMASKAKALYDANPGRYTPSSYSNMKVGKICAIIGLILSLLGSLYYIIVILILGAASFIPWDLYNA